MVQAPDPPPSGLLVLALHGYGSTPEAMLRLTALTLGTHHVIAALAGPFPHYIRLDSAPRSRDVGYGWGVHTQHDEAIHLHHAFVLAVRDRLCARYGIPTRHTVLTGFSQSVGLNYRLIGTHPGAAGAVIGLCGGVPNDWEEDKYQRVEAPILHISRDADEVYPVATALQFADRLRRHAGDVEFHMLPGGHRYPSKAGPLMRRWLGRVFPQANCT